MGESGVRDNRQLSIFISVGIVFAIIIAVLLVRSCAPRDPNAGYTVVYSNLDLRDAANVVTQLKVLKNPYQIRDNGKSVAVPKGKADEARLGLAEKNLPLGGSVGWEIFDQSKLGTTDFDRQVQFVRAISGELSRTINRLDSIEDSRIQIVIPKTTLFEVAKAPVTASVLLQLKTGRQLSPEQISGVVHLVAGSVENLRPENVIIVDIYGNILSGPASAVSEKATYIPEPALQPIEPPATSEAAQTVIMTKEVSVVPAVPQAQITAREQELERSKKKEAYENRLSSKVQTIINNFYPPNSILIKVNLELVPSKQGARKAQGSGIKRMTVIVLVDNRFNLTTALKKTTFETIAGSLPYSKKRGDRIILRKVPFHYATEFNREAVNPSGLGSRKELALNVLRLFGTRTAAYTGAALLLVLMLFVLLIRRSSRQKKVKQSAVRGEEPRPAGSSGAIEQMRGLVGQSPERIADLLTKWLTEEKEGS
jgi:flagellar M-ring protein FliF